MTRLRDQFSPAMRWLLALACLAMLALSGCSPAAGAWSGTIRISRTGESVQTTGAGTCCTETTQRTLNDVVTVEVVSNQATGQVSYNYAEHLKSVQAYDPGTQNITVDTVTTGSGEDSKRSRVTVSLAKDGSYEIEVEVPLGGWYLDARWQLPSSRVTGHHPVAAQRPTRTTRPPPRPASPAPARCWMGR